MDLSDTETTRGLFAAIKPEIIFHLASHVSGNREVDAVMPTFKGNLLSTVNLLMAADEIGCGRIILAGSMEESRSGDCQTIPQSPYAAAKLASSAYGRMFFRLYHTPVVIAHIFMVYGPAQIDLNKVIPYVILSLLRQESPKLSSGRRQVDWIYVDDVVGGLIAMATAPDIEGKTIDVGSGVLVPIHTVMKRISDIIGPTVDIQFGALPDRPMEQVRIADIDDTYSRIGWKPETSLDLGLARTVDFYKNLVAAD